MGAVEGGSEQEFLSLEEAAAFLYVSKSTMYRLLNQGKLRGMKAGKQWRFRKEDLVDYMQRSPAALALANLPIEVLEAELSYFAEELQDAGASTEEADDSTLVGEAGKVRQLLRRMVWLLHARGGSDIHLEPFWEAGLARVQLRLRVNGELQEGHLLPLPLYEPLLMEWKELAGLSVEERTRPQDGSAQLTFGETLIQLRISFVPTLYGERLAVRDIPTHVPSLADLQLDHQPLTEWIARPNGLIIISGPTGSGKSTTQVACVHALLEKNVNIMMVEDPVMYLFPHGVTQLKVEHFSCAEGVRAILLQDPDVIVVGELAEDGELTRRTVQAAGTGHLVLACMHAHDSIAPLYEIANYVKPSQLAATLIGVVNQRVLRRLCPACKHPQQLDPELLGEIINASEAGGYHIAEGAVFYEATETPTCTTCQGRGYVGRFAIHEYLTFTPELKSAFLRATPIEELVQLARQAGFPSSFAVAMQKAVAGMTSVEEVMRRVPQWRG